MIRLVTFDVTNTLLRFAVPIGRVYSEAATAFGLGVDADATAAIFKRRYRAIGEEHPNFGRATIGWRRWWGRVVVSTLAEATTDSAVDEDALRLVADRLIDIYKTDRAWRLNDGCVELLEFVRTTGAVVGVVSNFDPRVDELLTNMGIRQHFDFVVNSYDAGLMKPHREIFDEAMRRSRLDVHAVDFEAMHIGDDLTNDYNGAIGVGWRALLVNDSSKVDRSFDGPIFSSLNGVCEYLKDNRHIFI